MTNEKKIDNTSVSEGEFVKDLSSTFVDSYTAMYDIELKVDELENMAKDIIPEEFKVRDIPEYLNKIQNLINDVVAVPSEMVTSLNTAINGIVEDNKENIEKLTDKVNEEIKNATDQAQNKLNEIKNSTNSEINKNIENSTEQSKDEIVELAGKLKIPAKAVNYPAMGIILKRFQIIKYRCEIIQKSLLIMMAKTRKQVLLSLLIGKDDAGSPVTTPIKTFLMSVAVVANVLATIIGIILNVINAIVILNVDAAGCAFGPTPKSFMMTKKMKVLNVKQSTTASIPEPIDLAITEASKQYEVTKGEVKKSQVLAMATSATSSVIDGGQFNPGNFPSLPKMNGTAIKQAINLLLMTLIDAEALPRYEKLTPTNIRFLVFLVTGFEPSAKKTFGMPGFP